MPSASSSTIRQNWAECLENVLNDYDALNFKLWMGADDESSEHPIRLHFAVAAYREMIEREDVRSLKLARDIYNKFLRPSGGLCAFIRPESREVVRQRLHALLKDGHQSAAEGGGGGQPSSKPKPEVPLVVLPRSAANLFEPCAAELDRYLRCQHRIFVSSQEFIDFFNASCGMEDAPMSPPSTSTASNVGQRAPQSDPLSASPARFLSETGFSGAGFPLTKRTDGGICGVLRRSHGGAAPDGNPTTKLTANSLLRSQRDREICFNSSVEKMFKPVTKFPYVGGNATTSKNDSAVSSSFSSGANGSQHHGGGAAAANRGSDSPHHHHHHQQQQQQHQAQRRYGAHQQHAAASSSGGSSARRNNANENGCGARLLPAFPRPPQLSASSSSDPHHNNYSHRSANNNNNAAAHASTQPQQPFRHDTAEGRQAFASLLISKLNSTYNKYKQYKKLDDQLNKIVNKEQPRSIRDVLMSSDMMDDDEEEEEDDDGDATNNGAERTSGGGCSGGGGGNSGGREADDDVDRYFRRRMCERTATEESGGDVTNNSGSQVPTPPHFGGVALNASTTTAAVSVQPPQSFRRTALTGNSRRRSSISPDCPAGGVPAAFAGPPKPLYGATTNPLSGGTAAPGTLLAVNNFHSLQYFRPQQLPHPHQHHQQQQQQQQQQLSMDYYHGMQQQNLFHFVQPTSMPLAMMSQSCINSYAAENTSSGGGSAMALSMVAPQHHHRSCSPNRPYRLGPLNAAAAHHHSHAQFAPGPSAGQQQQQQQQQLFCYGSAGGALEPSSASAAMSQSCTAAAGYGGGGKLGGGPTLSPMAAPQQASLLSHSQLLKQPAPIVQQPTRTFGFAPPPGGGGKSAAPGFASPYKDIYCDNDCDTSGIGSMTTHFSDASGAVSANLSASTLNKQQKRAAVFRKAREMANAEQQQQQSQQTTSGESFSSTATTMTTTTTTAAATSATQKPLDASTTLASQAPSASSQQKMTISYRSFRRDAGGEPSHGSQIPIVANVPWNKCLTFREFRRYLSIPSKDRRQFFFKTACEDGSAPYQLLLINDDAAVLPVFDGKIAAECRSLSDSE